MAAKGRLKVVGYARVSTEEQARFGVSLDAQREKIPKYCDVHDLDLVAMEVDAGVSAKSLDRPGVQRVLTMLDLCQAYGVVVMKLDRLTRSVRDFCELVDHYFGDKGGKQLFSIGDSIDTRTAMGRLVLTFGIAIAQWERETIVERTQGGMDQKRSKGEWLGGRIPYGFGLSQDGSTLVALESEQFFLGQILQFRQVEKLSLQSIADRLNMLDVPTRSGSIWRASTIQSILARITTSSATTHGDHSQEIIETNAG